MSNIVRVDLHVHTDTSHDCCTTMGDFELAFGNGQIDKVAITDHSRIGMAYELKERFGDRIIIGEEIMTTRGEIIGLFLEKEIPRRLSPEDTVKAIRDQGGIVYIPHPFDSKRSGIEKYEKYAEIMAQADIIEVYNSRCFTQVPNQKALAYAIEHNKLMASASDAHGPADIGVSYVEMEDFFDPQSFLAHMRNAKLIKNKMTVQGFFSPTKSRIQKRLQSVKG